MGIGLFDWTKGRLGLFDDTMEGGLGLFEDTMECGLALFEKLFLPTGGVKMFLYL